MYFDVHRCTQEIIMLHICTLMSEVKVTAITGALI